MYVKECEQCDGRGWTTQKRSKWFGLASEQVQVTCAECEGDGEVQELLPCAVCDGQGLLGETSDVCPTCNGTGTSDAFGEIPRSELEEGTTFARRCRFCHNFAQHVLTTGVQTKQRNITWESDETLREVEEYEAVQIRCKSCDHEEELQIDPQYHHERGERKPVEQHREETEHYTGPEARSIEL